MQSTKEMIKSVSKINVEKLNIPHTIFANFERLEQENLKMEIEYNENIWIINDGQYVIVEGESIKYNVYSTDFRKIIYSNDSFENCLRWLFTDCGIKYI